MNSAPRPSPSLLRRPGAVGPPLVARREGARLRDRHVVAQVLATLGLGSAAVAPVLSYECDRDAAGAVNCIVHRGMSGLPPLPDRKVARILSLEIESSSDRPSIADRRPAQSYSRLVLV